MACTWGCYPRVAALWIGSGAIPWLSKDSQTCSGGVPFIPTPLRKHQEEGWPGDRTLGVPDSELEVLLEHLPHPTLQLEKLGQHGR